jgi:hypothetical protein
MRTLNKIFTYPTLPEGFQRHIPIYVPSSGYCGCQGYYTYRGALLAKFRLDLGNLRHSVKLN